MRRRVAIRRLGAAGLIGLAGCSSITNSVSDEPSRTSTTKTGTTTSEPNVTWNETILKNGQYQLVATVNLQGADEVEIHRGAPTGNPIATLTNSGTHTIAGPNTDFGTAELGRMYVAAMQTEYGPRTVSSFMIGSQEPTVIPYFLNGLHGGHFPRKSVSGAHDRTYNQTVGGTQTTLSIKIPKALYQYYKSRLRTGEYGAYVSGGYDDPYINQVASQFEEFGERNDLSKSAVVDHAIAFVQDLKYTPDEVATGYNEYPRYPVETLVDRGGDCEDTVILLSTLLDKLGFAVKLILMPDAQHMALGLLAEDSLDGMYYEQDGKRYYYVETTGNGFGVGDLPSEVKNTNAKLVDIDASPVLVHKWAVTVDGHGANISTSLRNMGDTIANDAQLQILLKTRDGKTVAAAETSPVDLEPESTHTETLFVTPPDDVELRLTANVGIGGYLHDRSQSEWKAPIKK